ncbi:hypothetical protein TPY_2159 [Sulfobacillus acidophilus TPY]|nr:hypothetical protein TPY_2159 [Sulfobacillus acidophilus TPY]
MNQWDVLLGVFDAPFIAVVVLPVSYFSLTVDMLSPTFTERGGYFALGRHATRWQWWVRKMLALGILTIIFVGVLWATAIVVSGMTVPWGFTWSRFAAATGIHYPGGLSPGPLRQPPWLIMADMTLLLSVGLYAWGLVVLVVGWVTRHAIWGWVMGAVLAMVSYGLWMVHGGTPGWAWAPMNQLLLSTHRGFRVSDPPGTPTVWGSLITEMGVGMVAVVVGFAVFRRRVL